MKKETIECECLSDEHRLVFWMENDPGWEHLSVAVFLASHPSFWKRVWCAMKYVFGVSHPYGHFVSFMVKRDDLDKLGSLVGETKKFVK